jgi:6-pyruvoyltetrahydropterin/6-carboxytetrahydropterin synthase
MVRRRFRFEAAHELPGHPGECRRLHGHSYELFVGVEREVEAKSGMAIDFSDLKRIVGKEVIEPIDHRMLNELMDNPTAEMIAVWIWNRLSEALPGLAEVELHETENCSVIYRGE